MNPHTRSSLFLTNVASPFCQFLQVLHLFIIKVLSPLISRHYTNNQFLRLSCIAKVPKLEELHTAYKDRVFEIVCVSFEYNYDDWKQGLEDNEVPRIHNADLRRQYEIADV